MSDANKIPAGPKDLTPALLTELVSTVHPDVRITDARVTKIKNYGDADTTSSVSTSIQVSLEVRYEKPCKLPTHVLAKMSIPEDADCANPPLEPFFENEVAFYQRLRSELDIEAPQAMGGRFDPVTGRYVLLMEDLSPRTPHVNIMMDEDNVAVVQALLTTLASVHAHFWQSPRFASDLSWVQNHLAGSLETLLDGPVRLHIVNELARERFKREFAQELGVSEAEMFAGVKALKRHQSTLPQTLLHGDAHFGNTYVMPDGTGGLLDWQIMVRGYLMHDIGYLIQTALSVEGRRKHERELLAHYREQLRAKGAKDAPDLESLWLEYRCSMLYGFYMGWLTAPRENYGLEVCVVGNHRTKTACIDHESVKLVRQLM
ncbi:MAG: aminoglycoside phosphotransferase family protein [Steroidobacteraceae bacterium]